ncbi:MAG: ABC-type branched-chain amino acid transport system, periplasmic component [Firmicutes bacterium]|nr:ABC-type branched-chain amino acid transport system, periplasmic component [Bacillota bacterium]
MFKHWTRQTVAIAAVTALAIGLAGCGGTTTPSNNTTTPAPAATNTNKDPIKLGAVFILTGPSAGYGVSQQAGLKVALAEINAAGGINGHQLDVQIEDSAGDKDKAINATQKLIDKDNVLAIIGPTLSAEMFAAGPVATQKGVPILGVSNTANGITAIGNYVFRNSLPEEGVLPTVVKTAKDKAKVANAALLFDNQDDFSKSGGDVFKAAMDKEGIKIVDTETFGTKDNDFGAQIDKALAAKPDGIFISSLYPAGSQLLIQLRAKGYKGPVFGGNGFNSPKVFEIANNASENLTVGSPWFSGATTPEATKFIDAYKKANDGKVPDQFAAQAYDGLKLMAKAIEKANTTTNRDKVRDALAGITDYVGATGKFAFDKDRNPVQAPFVLQIQGGKYVELK